MCFVSLATIASDQGKAQAFAGDDGRILRAAANLGHVQTVDARAARKYGFSETAWHKTHDSAYVPQGRWHGPAQTGTDDPCIPSVYTKSTVKMSDYHQQRYRTSSAPENDNAQGSDGIYVS